MNVFIAPFLDGLGAVTAVSLALAVVAFLGLPRDLRGSVPMLLPALIGLGLAVLPILPGQEHIEMSLGSGLFAVAMVVASYLACLAVEALWPTEPR